MPRLDPLAPYIDPATGHTLSMTSPLTALQKRRCAVCGLNIATRPMPGARRTDGSIGRAPNAVCSECELVLRDRGRE